MTTFHNKLNFETSECLFHAPLSRKKYDIDPKKQNVSKIKIVNNASNKVEICCDVYPRL